jgi:hypothetical protein
MRWCFLATIALTGAGCGTTTTVDPVANSPAPRQFVEEGSSKTSVEATDRGPDEPDVVVVATSPTEVTFRADARDTVVPLRRAPQPTVSKRKARVTDGMWIGAGIGVLAGLVSGSASDQSAKANGADCDIFGCGAQVFLGSALLGAVGLGLGAAVGGIVGAFESP